MSVSITLNHTIAKTASGTVSMKLEAVAYGTTSKIFAIEMSPKSADPQNPYYRFSHVCSPAELIEFPEDTPRDDCYFRTNAIEMVFDADDLVVQVLEGLKSDVADLVHELNELENPDNMFTGSSTF